MVRRSLVLGALLLALAALGCGGAADTESTAATTAPSTSSTATTPTSAFADLEPVVQPTLPEVIPGYTEVDPATGLHVTGTPTVVDLAGYHLKVTGKIAHELSLSYDDLRRLPKVSGTPRLVCPGIFVDTTTWSGVALHTVLEMAGVQPGATEIKMTSADGYWVFLDLDRALGADNFLAYELMGRPLPVLHGFPLRAVLPNETGNLWVKWLVEIVVE